MPNSSVKQTSTLAVLTERKAQIIGMATRLRRSIGYNEAFDTNNACNSEGLCSNLKAIVDVWEAEQLGRLAEDSYTLNPSHS